MTSASQSIVSCTLISWKILTKTRVNNKQVQLIYVVWTLWVFLFSCCCWWWISFQVSIGYQFQLYLIDIEFCFISYLYSYISDCTSVVSIPSSKYFTRDIVDVLAIFLKDRVMQIEKTLINDHLLINTHEHSWMRKFQCLVFVLKGSLICYYIICMTVPSKQGPCVCDVQHFELVLLILPYLYRIVVPSNSILTVRFSFTFIRALIMFALHVQLLCLQYPSALNITDVRDLHNFGSLILCLLNIT